MARHLGLLLLLLLCIASKAPVAYASQEEDAAASAASTQAGDEALPDFSKMRIKELQVLLPVYDRVFIYHILLLLYINDVLFFNFRTCTYPD